MGKLDSAVEPRTEDGEAGPPPLLPQKTGTAFTATMHILTAMVGAGVLAMPNSVAQMGWVGGIVCLLFFSFVQLTFSQLLASVFEVDGKQHPRYFEAVAHVLGQRAKVACAVIQGTNIVLVDIAYTLTASISMQVIANFCCGLPPDTNIGSNNKNEGCFNDSWVMTAIFGGAQVLFSQLPSMEGSWVLSTVGTATAVFYSSVALVLSLIKVAQGNVHGTVGGVSSLSPADKAFSVMNALGTIGFAYSFSQILLEIQDTLREPPKAEASMRKSIRAGLAVGTGFYTSVAVFGYMAFGDKIPPDVYSAFSGPKGLLIVCNLLVVLHMCSAYNVFAQALFLTLEEQVGRLLGVEPLVAEVAREAAAAAAPPGAAVDEADVERACSQLSERLSFRTADGSQMVGSPVGPYRMLGGHAAEAPVRHWRAHPAAGRLMSVGVRTVYVVLTTVIAICMPFFSQVTGLVGSIAFWPLAIYFPLAMYERVHKPSKRRRLYLRTVAGFMALVALGATIASVRNIISKWSTFTFI